MKFNKTASILGASTLCLLCFAQIHAVFIKTNGPSNLTLQIAWDDSLENANIAGSPKDSLRTHNPPRFEARNIIINDNKPFEMPTMPGKTIYVALAHEGIERSQQLIIPVLDDATLYITDLGEGELAVERPIGLVNQTDQMIAITLLKPTPDYITTYVPEESAVIHPDPTYSPERQPVSKKQLPIYNVVLKNCTPEGYKEPFVAMKAEACWTRKIESQELKLTPANEVFNNGCLSMMARDGLLYRLYQTTYRFMLTSRSEGIEQAKAGGILKAAFGGKDEKQNCSLDQLFPLTGERDLITFNQGQSECEEPQELPFMQYAEYIDHANNQCGIFRAPTNTTSGSSPYIQVRRGVALPTLSLE